ncbi:MAG: HEAT repeat domain-containing protein [Myxococcales bacterium]
MLLSRARVLAACAAALSCNRLPPGAVAVGTLSVSDGNLARVPELGLPADQVRKEMRAALERTRHFAVRDGASARVRLEVESARRLAGGEGAAADVQLILELTAASPEGEPERTVSEGAGRSASAADAGAEASARLASFEGALRGALDDAARGLAWQLESRRKTDDELSRDLGDTDARVRDYAIRALADRRSPAVVPQLIARLEDDNPAVALRAVGALVAIGDRRAVEPLIEMTRKRPPQLVAQVLYALASLGGPTAEAFLYTLESGAPDDEVRHAATDALAELRRKRDEASAHDANPTRPRSH